MNKLGGELKDTTFLCTVMKSCSELQLLEITISHPRGKKRLLTEIPLFLQSLPQFFAL